MNLEASIEARDTCGKGTKGPPLVASIYPKQCPGSFGTYVVGQGPSDSKSNWLHVDIFRLCFIHVGYILT